MRKLYFLFSMIGCMWQISTNAQILSCVDSEELMQARNYILNDAMDGMIYQLNLLGSDKQIKNSPTILESAQQNFINDFFVDSNSYFFSTFGNIDRPNPKILDVLKDMNIFHRTDSIKFDLSDKQCKTELYYENGQKGLKPFMYIVLTGVLTVEITNAKTDYYKVTFDTLAFFYKLSAYNTPGTEYYTSLNLENIKIWQVIKRNMYKELKNILPVCGQGEIANYVEGSESESFQVQEFGPLEFITNPADAQIRFLGIPQSFNAPIITDTFSVNRWKVTVSMKGYYPKDTTIDIYATHKNNVYIKLTPKQGRVQFQGPQNPDMIVIDGSKQQPFYSTPYVLNVGPHKIQLFKEFYNDTLIEIEIEPDKLATIPIRLSNKKGTLVISNTDGSALNSVFSIEGSRFINNPYPAGKINGFSVQVNQGYIAVEFLKMPWRQSCTTYQVGFVTYRDTILVNSKDTVTLDVSLTPFRTALIKTKPQSRGLELYVDGVQMYCSPPGYIPLTIGYHNFRFQDGDTIYDEFNYYVKPKKDHIKFKLNKDVAK